MEVHFSPTAKGEELIGAIGFKVSEAKFFLAVLKGIQTVVKADFIQRAINNLEEHLKPKALPMINYFHTCVHCTRSIDERDDNTMCLTRDGDTKWKCRVCAPLKKNRPQ